VLCHREDFEVFCALELDDKTHDRPERLKRDRILNQACRDAGVDLHRMYVDHKEKRISLLD
ncbi:DUF2726 domain-containing protein, partial [Halomonas smyrnensis]|uniref:DUF2726 domain-containing protein n=1 Tax=Halomonas smyrnensis TaxID=720605 RepID=UPI0012E99EEB